MKSRNGICPGTVGVSSMSGTNFRMRGNSCEMPATGAHRRD
jgi:hypothetical protein